MTFGSIRARRPGLLLAVVLTVNVCSLKRAVAQAPDDGRFRTPVPLSFEPVWRYAVPEQAPEGTNFDVAVRGAADRPFDEVQLVSPADHFAGFGIASALGNGLLVVGASSEQNDGVSVGAAYVYRLTGADWFLEARLSTPDTTSRQRFGTAVALDRNPDGDFVIVGAPGIAKV